MIRLRPYKSCDSKIIEKWVQDKEVFMKWGGDRFGEFPVSAQMIDAARIKSDQSKVRKTEGYALYYIRQGGTHNVETNEAA